MAYVTVNLKVKKYSSQVLGVVKEKFGLKDGLADKAKALSEKIAEIMPKFKV